jgi:hypothetical protein
VCSGAHTHQAVVRVSPASAYRVQHAKGWLDLVGGVDLVCKESLQRQLDEMRLQLAGTDPTSLESLAVQRVLAAWVQVPFADALAAQAQERQTAGAPKTR